MHKLSKQGFKSLLGLALLLASLGALVIPASAGQGQPPEGTPVVLVELFTSEGCSSCPPADQLLIELEKQGPEGVEVLVLSQHVDYWDQLGWKDPFSSPVFTARQKGYASRMGLSTIYTPQVVVDGVEEMVGSDSTNVRAAIARAAQEPKVALDLTAQRGGNRVQVRGQLAGEIPSLDASDWIIAIVETDLFTEVPRGENRGRTLPHTGVVRTWKYYRATELSKHKTIELGSDWKPKNLRVVSFVQERRSGRILALASTRF